MIVDGKKSLPVVTLTLSVLTSILCRSCGFSLNMVGVLIEVFPLQWSSPVADARPNDKSTHHTAHKHLACRLRRIRGGCSRFGVRFVASWSSANRVLSLARTRQR